MLFLSAKICKKIGKSNKDSPNFISKSNKLPGLVYLLKALVKKSMW